MTLYFTHLSLVAISLIPAVGRSFQMWGTAPGWVELVVELPRLLLILLMIRFLTQATLRHLSSWKSIGRKMKEHIKTKWVEIIAQLIVILAVFFLINTAISWIWSENHVGMILDALQIQHDVPAAVNTFIFFTKNMTVIPIATICYLQLLGIKNDRQTGM